MRAEGKAACRLSGCFMRSPTSSVGDRIKVEEKSRAQQKYKHRLQAIFQSLYQPQTQA